jgi:hypothetical protein
MSKLLFFIFFVDGLYNIYHKYITYEKNFNKKKKQKRNL